MRGLNEGNKHLRVRNLLREWKANVNFFRKLNWSMSCSVVHIFWGLPTFGLLLFRFKRGFWWDFAHKWDRRVVGKSQRVCEGVYCCPFF